MAAQLLIGRYTAIVDELFRFRDFLTPAATLDAPSCRSRLS